MGPVCSVPVTIFPALSMKAPGSMRPLTPLKSLSAPGADPGRAARAVVKLLRAMTLKLSGTSSLSQSGVSPWYYSTACAGCSAGPVG